MLIFFGRNNFEIIKFHIIKDFKCSHFLIEIKILLPFYLFT